MSRIGKLPVELNDKVTAKIDGNTITIKGPKGELSYTFTDKVQVEQTEEGIVVTPKDEQSKAIWGTTRANINNMVIGVTEGYKKSLEINGVGYKFEVQGKKLVLSVGFSHKVEMEVPEGLKAEMDEKQKNLLHISGISKQLVGEFASKVRDKKKPEPYKGKGIRYLGEYVKMKAGKTGAK